MPWRVGDKGSNGCDGFPVIKISDGKVAGCHDTEEQAQAQVKALYANEPTVASALDPVTRQELEAFAQRLASAGVAQVPEPVAAVVAAAYVISVPDVPPREWFDKSPTPPPNGQVTITDTGRIYGYLARKNVAHRGYPDRKITVPMGNVDYSTWMSRESIVAAGDTAERLATGVITMDCGHASVHPSVQAAGALEHYDNTCSIVATARVGEDAEGVWIAGAVVPGTSASQISRLLASGLSGDWRPHRERPGQRELCGILAVPVPGFPVANPNALSMVASVSYQETECDHDAHENEPDVAHDSAILTAAGILAKSVNRDVTSRARELARRVGKAQG